MGNSIFVGLPAYGNTVSVATLNSIYSLMQVMMQKGMRGGMAAFSYPEISESRNIMLTGVVRRVSGLHAFVVR
jgi:hypothetical protein